MLTIENSLIVVIDVQGKLAEVVAEAELANQNVSRLVQAGLELNLPILLTAQVPEKIGHTTEAIRTLLPDHKEYPRTTFSIWLDEDLRDTIKQSGKEQIILCGFESHICLYQSALDLLEEGYEVWLVADAVSSRSLVNKGIALTELSAEGVHLTSVESLLFSLIRDAKHPAFKAISKLIR